MPTIDDYNKLKAEKDLRDSKLIRNIIIGVVSLVALVVAYTLRPIATVPAGYTGVMTSFGAPSSTIYAPGIHFRTPISQAMNLVYTGTRNNVSDVAGTSKDLQQVDAKVAVNFHVRPDAAVKVFVQFGGDVWARVMDPAIHDVVKAVSARYDATDLIQKRDQVGNEIREALTGRFGADGVEVTAVNIVDFQFSKQFNDAIEAKITAQQNALRVENEIAQTKYEAQKRVVESEAELQVAQNKAKANELMGKSLEASPALVEMKKIEKWDGHYPQYMLGAAMPMIQLTGSK
jgi:regulator of protease activity HflC (stomatin/prohibitin superfamily)